MKERSHSKFLANYAQPTQSELNRGQPFSLALHSGIDIQAVESEQKTLDR